MPNWKKLIVSGSDASLNSLNVTNNVTAQSFTGSFSGSFTAPGATTQVVYNSGGVLSANSGFVYSGSYVGIGTTSPSSILEISQATPTVRIGSSDVTQFHGIEFLNGGNLDAFIKQLPQTGEFKISNGRGTGWGGHITLYTDTAERMRITSAGNVGIGTTSPGAKLHVASGEIRVDAGQAVTLDTGNVMYLVGASSQLRLYNGGNPIVNITTGGNVGIGTTSPSQVLEVQGQAQIGNDNVTSAGLFIARKNSNQAKSHYFLSAQESPTYQWIEGGYFTSELAGVSVANNSGKPYYESYSPAGQYKSFGFINQQTSGSSFTSTAVTASVVLYQGGNIALAPTLGNVGIGTTSPTYKLHISSSNNGDGLAIHYPANNSTLFPFIISSNADSAGDYARINTSIIELKRNGGACTIKTVGSSNNLALESATNLIFNTNGASERMRIDTSGNVGIGTTSPGAKLQISGGTLDGSALTELGISSGLTTGRLGTFDASSLASISTRGDASSVELAAGSSATYYTGISATANNATLFTGTLRFFTSGSEKVRVTSGGNVGIGTTSPTQKLDVAGAISVSGSVIDYEVSPSLISPGPGTNIISFTPGTHYAAFVDYVIKDASTGANQRVGTIMVSISLAGAAAVMNEVTTVDIGNTSAITFSVSYGAPTWLVAANSGITPFDINYMVRYF